MSGPNHRQHSFAVWAALLVTVYWSSSWVLVRVGLDDESLQPVTFAGLRYGLASLVLIGWVSRSKTSRAAVADLSRNDLVWFGVLGLVFYTLTQGAQFVAIDSQPLP